MHGINGRLDSTNVKRYTVHENGATPVKDYASGKESTKEDGISASSLWYPWSLRVQRVLSAEDQQRHTQDFCPGCVGGEDPAGDVRGGKE